MVIVSIRLTHCANCTLPLSNQPANRVKCRQSNTLEDYCDVCFSLLFVPAENGPCTVRREE